ncbi:hypothetical protein [Cellulomonas rhizosphaerae]|uniref:Uncharacterized protein n=1 Tax=Cellulomonas rhizosphaerae TaxID=2293719 RepID=A0A413RJK4_9CELL|nr:hypothetical protein [Cellulomonas rhizosphaerae]RHA38810.1 hypothetical protein D1825_13010 [Cellulomonas rhizosphaerae]
MSDSPQVPDAEAQEGGYGYPTLEQEVTPEVLEAGAESDGPREPSPIATDGAEESDGGDRPAPGEHDEDPPAVEPPD